MAQQAHSAQPVRLSAEVGDSFASVRPTWEAMVADGISTPYQAFGFVEPYFRHVAATAGAKSALITLHDGTGAPAALLPLMIYRLGPLRIAEFLGGKQSNFNMPVYGKPSDRITPDALAAVLKQAAATAGIDLFAFKSQPVEWQGFANPLAALQPTPAPSQGYKLQLGPDAEAVLKRQLSKDTRRKLRQKEQKLSAIGTVHYRVRQTEDEIRTAFTRFLALKAERFAAQGIHDPFGDADTQAFLASALTDRRGGGASIELHTLDVDDRIVAIFGMVPGKDRISGLFTAFDSDVEISRCSPGDLLLVHIIRDACARGFSTFDLGVGEAHYKDKVCDETDVLVDSFLPMTAGGKAMAAALYAKQGLKRMIKTSAVGKRAIAALRSLKAR